MKTDNTTEIDRQKIGLTLNQLRTKQQLSLADVGKEIGFKRGQIWQFEQGIGLTFENLAKLARFYDKPLEFFINQETV